MSSYKVIFVDESGQNLTVFDTDNHEEPVASITIDNENGENPHPLAGNLLDKRDAYILAIPSPWCLSSTVSVGNLPKRARANGIPFLLEEVLPMEAESVFYATQTGSPDTDAFGVCCDSQRLETLISHLNIPIWHIIPSALLATGFNREDALFALANGTGCDLIRFAESRIQNWAHCETEELLESFLRYHVLSSETDLNVTIFANCDSRWKNSIRRIEGLNLDIRRERTLRGDICSSAKSILRGEIEPILDLGSGKGRILVERSGFLRHLTYIVAAILTLFLSIAVYSIVHAQKYADLEESYRRAASTLFEENFPGEDMPEDFSRFLLVEVEALEGRRQEILASDEHPDIFRVLCGALLELPNNVRHKISEIGIDETFIRIKGEVRSPSDVDLIMNGIEKCGLVDLEQPQTSRVNAKRVRFVVRGTISSD